MEFWTGVLLGCGIGGTISVVIMLFSVAKASSVREKGPLAEYWQTSMENQKKQIEVLDEISRAITDHH